MPVRQCKRCYPVSHPLSYFVLPWYHQFETVRQHLHTSTMKDLSYCEHYASDTNTYQAHFYLEAWVGLNHWSGKGLCWLCWGLAGPSYNSCTDSQIKYPHYTQTQHTGNPTACPSTALAVSCTWCTVHNSSSAWGCTSSQDCISMELSNCLTSKLVISWCACCSSSVGCSRLSMSILSASTLGPCKCYHPNQILHGHCSQGIVHSHQHQLESQN